MKFLSSFTILFFLQFSAFSQVMDNPSKLTDKHVIINGTTTYIIPADGFKKIPTLVGITDNEGSYISYGFQNKPAEEVSNLYMKRFDKIEDIQFVSEKVLINGAEAVLFKLSNLKSQDFYNQFFLIIPAGLNKTYVFSSEAKTLEKSTQILNSLNSVIIK